jgi:preprotein translocase subunit SecF
LRFGIDFTGGTLIEVVYPEPAELEGIRDVQVQRFGTARDVLIRIAPRADEASAPTLALGVSKADHIKAGKDDQGVADSP